MASNDVKGSNGLALAIQAVIGVSLPTLLSSAQNVLEWSDPINFSRGVAFGATDPDPIGFNELGNAFGQVIINGTLRVYFRRDGPNAIWVESVEVTGSFDDLYDFDYMLGGPSVVAAQVQAGHATLPPPGNQAGRIFYTRVEFTTGTKVHQRAYP